MNRYGKYFVNHTLWLDDGFSNYYLQGITMDPQQIQDVESVVFNWPEEAEQWINQCMAFEPAMTLRKLRGFLTECCMENYSVHEMSQSQVIREAARQLCRQSLRLVIEPKMGWAVQVDPETAEPVQPLTVEPAPDIEGMLDELQTQLNGLVAEQKRNYQEWEAKLAQMDEAEVALLYGKKAGDGLYNATIGSVVGLVKSLPGLAKKAAKAWWKFKTYPLRLAQSTARAIEEGSWGPLKREVEAVVDPVVRSAKKVHEITSMVAVLLGEQTTRDMLLDFVDRYWDNTHPLEKTEMGAEAASEVVMTILLAIFTAGVGAAANIAAKSGRMVKVAKLLKKVANTLKRVSSLHRLPKKRTGGGAISRAKSKNPNTKKSGVPEPETPKKKADADKKKDKDEDDRRRRKGADLDREKINDLVKAGKINEARDIVRPFMEKGQWDEVAARLDVSSPKDGAVFWSGTKDKASEFAKDLILPNGKKGVTLEDTIGGKVLDKWDDWDKEGFSWDNRGGDPPPYKEDLWKTVSEKYAEGARGKVYSLQTEEKLNNPKTIWNQVEKRVLKSNKRAGLVDEIIIITI